MACYLCVGGDFVYCKIVLGHPSFVCGHTVSMSVNSDCERKVVPLSMLHQTSPLLGLVQTCSRVLFIFSDFTPAGGARGGGLC